jgi:hypothetical protein
MLLIPIKELEIVLMFLIKWNQDQYRNLNYKKNQIFKAYYYIILIKQLKKYIEENLKIEFIILSKS